jgi:hypothetical protein
MATALAARHALLAIFPVREYALAGGLMTAASAICTTNGASTLGAFSRRETRGDLPVQQTTDPHLKTAKALGIVLIRAADVIEWQGRGCISGDRGRSPCAVARGSPAGEPKAAGLGSQGSCLKRMLTASWRVAGRPASPCSGSIRR